MNNFSTNNFDGTCPDADLSTDANIFKYFSDIAGSEYFRVCREFNLYVPTTFLFAHGDWQKWVTISANLV
jgi:hypothetical protein